MAGVAHVRIARIVDVLDEVPGGHAWEGPDKSIQDLFPGWLSESEAARIAGIRSDARRAQYLAGHWLVRVLLASAFGETPERWRLLERRSQPPQVQGQTETIRVSISHTREWIAAAVAPVAIGIDLEQRPRPLDAAIEPLLRNADEAPGSLDPDALLQRWVAKEAWIKRLAESALPARLMRLRLLETDRDRADVWIDSSDAFHFGVAAGRGCAVEMQCPVPLAGSVGFAVREPGSGA